MTAWAVAEHSLDLDGRRLSYVDEGEGPPVVLVHGNPTWSFYFRSLVAALPPAGFRALAPDHIGMGRSDKPAASAYRHTLQQRVDDFGRFVDSLHLAGPLSLVVHDWGGAIALAWAVDRPERVDRLVLLNTAAFPLPEGKPLPLALRAARVPGLGAVLVRHLNAFSLGAVALATSRAVLPAAARQGLLAPYDTPAHRVAVHEFVRDIPLAPTDPAYAVLERTAGRLHLLADKPTLICWGMRDFVFDADILAVWERLLPGARIERYADAGHYVLEDAADRIVPAVLEHLSA